MCIAIAFAVQMLGGGTAFTRDFAQPDELIRDPAMSSPTDRWSTPRNFKEIFQRRPHLFPLILTHMGDACEAHWFARNFPAMLPCMCDQKQIRTRFLRRQVHRVGEEVAPEQGHPWVFHDASLRSVFSSSVLASDVEIRSD